MLLAGGARQKELRKCNKNVTMAVTQSAYKQARDAQFAQSGIPDAQSIFQARDVCPNH
jgi:hypothetical protein